MTLLYHGYDEKKKMQVEMICLKIKLSLAREKLQKAWSQYGVTNAQVLQASNEFDAMLNEYQLFMEKSGFKEESPENPIH